MKNKKPLGLNVKAALAVAAVSLLCLPAWRDIWIYFE